MSGFQLSHCRSLNMAMTAFVVGWLAIGTASPLCAKEATTVLQSGIQCPIIRLMAFDRSGEYLAVAGLSPAEQCVTVWHLPTRTLMARFQSAPETFAPYQIPRQIRFVENPLRVQLITDQMSEVWQIEDGKYDVTEAVLSTMTSESGRFVAQPIQESKSSKIIIRDSKSDQTVEFATRSAATLRAFSRDERFLAVSTKDALHVFDWKKGRLVMNADSNDLVHSACFSNDNSLLSVEFQRDGNKRGQRIYHVDSGEIRFETVASLPCPDRPTLAMFAKGEAIAPTWSGGGTELLRIPFNEDAKPEKAPPEVWNVIDGIATALAVHEDSGMVAVGAMELGKQPWIELYDFDSGIQFGNLSGQVDGGIVSIDPKTNEIFQASNRGVARWDLQSGSNEIVAERVGGRFVGASAGELLYRRRDRLVLVSKTDDGDQRLRPCLQGAFTNETPIVLSQSLEFATTTTGQIISVWNLSSGQMRNTIKREEFSPGRPIGPITNQGISNTGELLALTDANGNVELWDLGTEERLHSSQLRLASVGQRPRIAMIADGCVIASDYGVDLFTTEGSEIGWKRKRIRSGNFSNVVSSVDGTRVACVNTATANIEVIGLPSVETTAILPCRPSNVSQVLFTNRNDELMTVTPVGEIELWSLAKKALIAKLTATQSGGSIIRTPDGFYKANRNGRDAIAYRIENRMIPLQEYGEGMNRPDIILRRLGRADPETVSVHTQVVEWRHSISKSPERVINSKVSLRLPEPLPMVSVSSNLDFGLEIDGDQARDADRVSVRINGVLVQALNVQTDNRPHVNISVKLLGGDNVMTIRAHDENDRQLAVLVHSVHCTVKEETGRFAFVGIGVSSYRDDAYDLRYAKKDAQDISTVFREIHGDNLRDLVLVDGQATKKNFLRSVAEFLSTLAPADTVVVYLAGHGFVASGEYCFALHDCNFADHSNGVLRFGEIDELLNKSPARRRVLLLDSCHAGDVIPENVAGIPIPEHMSISKRSGLNVQTSTDPSETAFRKILFEQFGRESTLSGTAVITASDGGQYALESKQWQNGAFTYAVNEALRTKSADLNKDHRITVSELLAFVSPRVQMLTGSRQSPQERYLNPILDSTIAAAVPPERLSVKFQNVTKDATSPSTISISNSEQFMAASFKSDVHLLDLNTGTQIVSNGSSDGDSIYRLEVTDDGRLVVGRQYQDRLFSIDGATGKRTELYPVGGKGGLLGPLLCSHDRNRFFSHPDSDGFHTWTFDERMKHTELHLEFDSSVISSSTSSDGAKLRVLLKNGEVHDIQTSNGKTSLVSQLGRFSDLGFGAKLRFSATGDWLVRIPNGSDLNNTVECWSIDDQKRLNTAGLTSAGVIVFENDQVLVSDFGDNFQDPVRSIYDVSIQEYLPQRFDFADQETLVVSRSGALLATIDDSLALDADRSSGIRIIRTRDAKEVAWLERPNDQPLSYCFGADDATLFAANGDGDIWRWAILD